MVLLPCPPVMDPKAGVTTHPLPGHGLVQGQICRQAEDRGGKGHSRLRAVPR